MGERDQKGCEEALKFAHQQIAVVDNFLESTQWLANDSLSVADLFAFAYLEQFRPIQFPLDDYTHVQSWYDRIEGRESITRARAKASG